ncbi:tyrosine-type recombinase/integrase [Odoribacter laneus]|uniref:Tyr recombinase domain-containing protein n=1 Tax=Odoribacter laneus YIT 12061 TaxID=742817 RepID=H1DE29_9BACT|nr:tyrosine-type recombinase/integrase [Odoribacter laneus]EHP50826.1 hypothetical protein HMPREF9449_00515 [Odoribacter laneus YIT 12061]
MSRKEVVFMNREFLSIFASHLEDFLNLKRNLGYKYNGSAYILYNIDKCICDNNLKILSINKEFALNWCAKRSNEANRTWYGRVVVFREFAIYLTENGTDAYVPARPKHPTDSYVPYVFTHDEIERLFESADSLRLEKLEMRSAIFAIPVLLRFLYETGLRVSEAMALKNRNISLVTKTVLVTNCKNGKDRLIPISDSLVKICQTYLYYRDMLNIVTDENSYFFVSINGNKLYQTIVYRWYRVCLENAGIPFMGKSKGPRVHDLRHTFAVHSMASMADSGLDMYVSLPILSTYMGHDSLKSTEYYVRLTAEMFPSIVNNLETNFTEIFPNI